MTKGMPEPQAAANIRHDAKRHALHRQDRALFDMWFKKHSNIARRPMFLARNNLFDRTTCRGNCIAQAHAITCAHHRIELMR